jgi:hypothetical protein
MKSRVSRTASASPASILARQILGVDQHCDVEEALCAKDKPSSGLVAGALYLDQLMEIALGWRETELAAEVPPCALKPLAIARASTSVDFPDPFSPTMKVTPGSGRNAARSRTAGTNG